MSAGNVSAGRPANVRPTAEEALRIHALMVACAGPLGQESWANVVRGALEVGLWHLEVEAGLRPRPIGLHPTVTAVLADVKALAGRVDAMAREVEAGPGVRKAGAGKAVPSEARDRKRARDRERRLRVKAAKASTGTVPPVDA